MRKRSFLKVFNHEQGKVLSIHDCSKNIQAYSKLAQDEVDNSNDTVRFIAKNDV